MQFIGLLGNKNLCDCPTQWSTKAKIDNLIFRVIRDHADHLVYRKFGRDSMVPTCIVRNLLGVVKILGSKLDLATEVTGIRKIIHLSESWDNWDATLYSLSSMALKYSYFNTRGGAEHSSALLAVCNAWYYFVEFYGSVKMDQAIHEVYEVLACEQLS